VIYANEIDPVACAVLRHCELADHVDERSIKLVRPDDLRPFRRAHFFAGAGLWEVACRLAGWPSSLPLWTASCPCQPFSAAGKGLGTDDPRHLWPDLFRLVSACRPACIVGEQVAGKAGDAWLDGVCADLESIGYVVRAVEVPASAVDSPQKRSRNWWVAMASADSRGRGGRPEGAQRSTLGRNAAEWADDGAVADAQCNDSRPDAGALERTPREGAGNASQDWPTRWKDSGPRFAHEARNSGANGFWSDAIWLDCADGKARRAPKPESYFRNVAYGIPAKFGAFDPASLLVPSFKGRTEAWRLAGNAIVPQVAAMFLASVLETM